MTGYSLWVVIGLTVAAYVVAYPGVAWTLSDLRRYPRHLWIGYGNRLSWERTAVVAYLALGLPALLVMSAWRFSLTRRELRALVRRMHSDPAVGPPIRLPGPAGVTGTVQPAPTRRAA